MCLPPEQQPVDRIVHSELLHDLQGPEETPDHRHTIYQLGKILPLKYSDCEVLFLVELV